jgi:hypothetical protein
VLRSSFWNREHCRVIRALRTQRKIQINKHEGTNTRTWTLIEVIGASDVDDDAIAPSYDNTTFPASVCACNELSTTRAGPEDSGASADDAGDDIPSTLPSQIEVDFKSHDDGDKYDTINDSTYDGDRI